LSKFSEIKNPSAEPRDLSKIIYLAFMCQIHQGTMIMPFGKPILLSFHLLSICGFSMHNILYMASRHPLSTRPQMNEHPPTSQSMKPSSNSIVDEPFNTM
jgi:hypothetical protein